MMNNQKLLILKDKYLINDWQTTINVRLISNNYERITNNEWWTINHDKNRRSIFNDNE